MSLYGSMSSLYFSMELLLLMRSFFLPRVQAIALLFFPLTCAAKTLQPVDVQAVTFPQCLTKLQSSALQAGLSPATVEQVLAKAKFDPRVINYDRRQPEFIETFSHYVTKRVTDWRINQGRKMLHKHKALLQSLTQQYGIPGHYLVAFWGLETNYGAYKGKMPIIDSLATLACDQRRSTFFTKQLLLALQLLEREQLSAQAMLGSWAGAMGHTQFMPSAYLQHAIDGDGDGRIDLWHSEEDALASAAHFLRNLGWQAGYRWGREVTLDDNFNYVQIGRDRQKSITQWAAQGVSKADASPLGQSALQASILLPAGAKGPAFLVYANFDVIMRWNNSEFYAIAVGYLADRIVGANKLKAPLPDLPRYSIAQIKQLQQALNHIGFAVGKADGIMGPATRKGISLFQASQGMLADGFPDKAVFDAVMRQFSAG